MCQFFVISLLSHVMSVIRQFGRGGNPISQNIISYRRLRGSQFSTRFFPSHPRLHPVVTPHTFRNFRAMSSEPKTAPSVPSWATHLPAPQSQPPWIDASEVEKLIGSSTAGVDFLVVDVRRNDLEVCTTTFGFGSTTRLNTAIRL